MDSREWFQLVPEISKHWSKNLAQLLRNHPEQAEPIKNCLNCLPDLEFQEVAPQQFTCRTVDSSFSLYDPLSFQSQLQQNLDRTLTIYQRGIDLVIIAGAGLGYLASHIELHIRGNYNKGLILLDMRPELLAAQLCLFDCQSLLESRQIYWNYSNDLQESLLSLIKREHIYYLPQNKITFVTERQLYPQERKEFQDLTIWLGRQYQSFTEERSRKRLSFQKRIQFPPNTVNGKIWAVATPDAYIHTPLIKSLLLGFEQQGWSRHLCEIQDGFSTRFRVAEHLLETVPDTILSVNAPSSSIVSKELDRPRICWILDHPQYYNYDTFAQRITERDHIFYIDKDYARYFSDLKSASQQQLIACPSVTRIGTVREELKAPIMFVGNHVSIEYLLRDMDQSLKNEVIAICNKMILEPRRKSSDVVYEQEIAASSQQNLYLKAKEYVLKIPRTFIDDISILDYYLYALANGMKRERYVRALLPFGLVVYGPDSWLNFLGNQYHERYRGWLSFEDLPDAYASANLSLNIHSLQCPTCLNNRDFDVLASHGILMSDYVEDMDVGVLEANKDFLLYRNEEELLETTAKIMENQELRDHLREQGYQTYLEKHTAKQRASEILRVLR